MTIRRAIVILVLLAIAFFIYRGISPTGADRLLTNIKHIPVRLGFLSGEIVATSPASTGTLWSGSSRYASFISGRYASFISGSLVSGISKKASSSEVHVFSSTLASQSFLSLEALVIPQQKDTTIPEPITSGGSLTIVKSTGDVIPTVVVKPKPSPVTHASVPTKQVSSSNSLAQDIRFLNNLFK